MKKHLFFVATLMLLTSTGLLAQNVVDYETLTVPNSGYFDGSSQHSGTIGSTEKITYSEKAAQFYSMYTLSSGYGYWNGFAYSNQTDQITELYTNYSAYATPAGGVNGSSNYGFVYTFASDSIMFNQPVAVSQMYLTNATYAYHYMKNTNGTGYTYTTGDYFIVTITGIATNGTSTGAIDFYLADFTNGNSMIIDNWTAQDLSSLGVVQGLKFSFKSTDTGAFGINTPTYFCMDNLSYNTTTSVEEITTQKVNIYPNPTESYLTISNAKNILISDLTGKIIYKNENPDKNETIDFQHFAKGIFLVKTTNNGKVKVTKVIKN